MIDTSLEAYSAAMKNPVRKAIKADVWALLQRGDLSADCAYRDAGWQKKWRNYYRDDHQALQDIRRMLSEFKAEGRAWDSGARVVGLYGKASHVVTATKPAQEILAPVSETGSGDAGVPPKDKGHQAGLISQLRGAHENWGQDMANGKTAEEWRRIADKYLRALGRVTVCNTAEEARKVAQQALKG